MTSRGTRVEAPWRVWRGEGNGGRGWGVGRVGREARRGRGARGARGVSSSGVGKSAGGDEKHRGKAQTCENVRRFAMHWLGSFKEGFERGSRCFATPNFV